MWGPPRGEKGPGRLAQAVRRASKGDGSTSGSTVVVVAAEETELTVALGRAGVTQGGRRLGGWALLCVLEEGGRAVRGRGAGGQPGVVPWTSQAARSATYRLRTWALAL